MRLQTSAILAALLFAAAPRQAEAGYTWKATVTSTGGTSAKTGAGVLGYGMKISVQCAQAARVQAGPQTSVTATSTSILVEAGQPPVRMDFSNTENAIAIIPAAGSGTTVCEVYERTGPIALLRWMPDHTHVDDLPLEWAGVRRRRAA